MNTLSLFTGIGALDLGLERAGMRIVGQVEIDEFCRRILAAHWPEVPRHDDVRTCAPWWGSEHRPTVDMVAGSPPCQPFSAAGNRLGTADARWGWPWMLTVVSAVRPRVVFLENVAALLRDRDAFSIILDDLSDLGFSVEWDVVSACSMGAPHVRRRLFVVAHPDGGDGCPWMGDHRDREAPGVGVHGRAGAWRDLVARSVEASRSDDRDTDRLASRMVAAGGNAVVPRVAEHLGRLILAADQAGGRP